MGLDAPKAPHTAEEEFRYVERYLLFVGCAIEDCEGAHNHPQGWDSCAAGSNDIDELNKEILHIEEHFWWHVLDLGQNPPRVIMRSSYAGAPRH